jgi:hypothetical protein
VREDRALGVRTRAHRAIRARFLFSGLLRTRVAVRYTVAAVLAAGGLLLGVLPMAAAHADTGGGLVSLTNADRASAGLAPLADNAALAAVAQAQANRMANSGVLAHNPSLGSDVCCWAALGENVGYGGSIQILNSAFLASPEHRANIMGHYNQIGIGIATGHGLTWVTEDFRLTAGASADTAPKAVAPAAAKPRQVHIPTRTVVVHPLATPTHTAVSTPTHTTATATLAVPERTVPGAASRSLPAGRLPLNVARQWATRWAGMLGSVQVTTTDPVSSVLSFAAQTAASAAS